MSYRNWKQGKITFVAGGKKILNEIFEQEWLESSKRAKDLK